MASDILIISNDDINQKFINKLVLLRGNDNIQITNIEEYKKNSNINFDIIILNSIGTQREELIKQIDYIQNKSKSKIILLLDNVDSNFIFQAYDHGVFDYFSINDENYTITIKIMNCFKYITLQEIIDRHSAYLQSSGAVDAKTGLYNLKYLKEIYSSIIPKKKVQRGSFAIISLDESVKTKVSTNRLALAIKKSVRSDDIAVTTKNGDFYIMMPDTNINDAGKIIEKLQSKMTDEYRIRAGIVPIGIQDFEELVKNAKDSYTSAIMHDQTYLSLANIEDNWLEVDNCNQSKQYKLFKTVYDKKLKYIVEPLFFKFQNELNKKLTKKAIVTQYANDIESSFSIKNDDLQSELILRFNGFSKLYISITHSGLETPENTKTEVPLKKFTQKELLKLLKQLKEEFLQGVSKYAE